MIAPQRIAESELHAFVDGELTDNERVEIEAALAASPADQELVRDVREINEALRQRYAGSLSEPLAPALLKPLARLGASRS